MPLLLSMLACTFLPQPYYDTGLEAAELCEVPAPSAEMGQVVGRITSPSGEVPVAGAQIEVGASSTVSGAGGCFVVDVEPGSATLSVEKGRYGAEVELEAYAGEPLDLGAVALDDGGVKVAVVYGKYDDVGALMEDLGLPFDVYAEPEELYGDAELLGSYDAVFANCGSTHTTQNNSAYSAQELDNMRAWILGGGTLYASDWEVELFEGAMPDAAVFADDPLTGPAGSLTAQVLDRNIETLLGTDKAQISYDLSGWAVIREADQATPLVMAEVEGGVRPLAVMHFEGEGRAVFTTFHNEAQITEDMRTILFELILAL